MANIILQGGASGTGSTTITGPSTNNTNTITLPDTTGGSIQVSSNMPAFSAYLSSNQSIGSANTYTKIVFDTKEFDTNTNFATGRFTPTVAGYYQINANVASTAAIQTLQSAIYKNGSQYKLGVGFTSSTTAGVSSNVSSIVYCNGSTDYIEIYVTAGFAFTVYGNGTPVTYFNGVLVRTA